MSWTVVYDIAQEPPFEPVVAWIAGGFIGVGLIWSLLRRAKDRKQRPPVERKGLTTPKVLMIFGSIIAVIGIGLMGWDHARLVKAIEHGEAQVVEGPVQSWGTERQRTARTDKREYNTYERFYIGDSIWFGYRWEVGQAGFHNGAHPRIAFHDGMLVRASYLYADGTDDPPRIVKLEIAE